MPATRHALALGVVTVLAALHPGAAEAQPHGRAASVGAGVGTVATARTGYVAQVNGTYDAPLRGRTRWWAGLQGAHAADPGVASPDVRQSVTELALSVGPLLEVPAPGRTALLLGGGVYGVARRYGAARRERGGPALTDAYWGGGDWGAVGRTALQVGDARALALLVDAQWRYAVEGSARRLQPSLGIGARRRW